MADPLGFLLVLFGLPAGIWPYEMARFGERIDAIGSRRRWHEVEPADWNVMLTRIVGVGFTLFGLVTLLG